MRLKNLDAETVEKYAMIGCTLREIADRFGVGHETIRRKYKEALQRGRALGKMKIRKAIWDVGVEKENTSILLHLAKHELGQHDKIRQELTGADGEPIETRQKADDLSQLSVEELEQLASIRKKIES